MFPKKGGKTANEKEKKYFHNDIIKSFINKS